MEKEQEIGRLVNVLYRVARAAHYAAWARPDPEAARFCAAQYNRVLARLGELEPEAAKLFTPLGEDAPPQVIRFAARELAAYFEDEGEVRHGGRRYAGGCGPWRMWFGYAPVYGRHR